MKILLTNYHLVKYQGTEMNTLEFATALKARGHDVTVLCVLRGRPMVSEFAARGIPLVPACDWNDHELSKVERDVLWCQHFPTLHGLLIKCKRHIHYSCGKVDFYEEPPKGEWRGEYFAVSEEVAKHWNCRHPWYKPTVLPNMAPEEYFQAGRPIGELRNILVVSNHVPSELRLALLALTRDGYNVRFVGEADEPTLVTRELLDTADVVVSIGKTVVYCMAMGKPVYVYDTHGGYGYMDELSHGHYRWYNYSGRGGRYRQPHEIAKEIVEGYALATSKVGLLRWEAQVHHSINGLFTVIEGKPTYQTCAGYEQSALAEQSSVTGG